MSYSRGQSQHFYKVRVTDSNLRKRKCSKCGGKGFLSYILGINKRTIEIACIECNKHGIVYPRRSK
jgi:hypothetical protein